MKLLKNIAEKDFDKQNSLISPAKEAAFRKLTIEEGLLVVGGMLISSGRTVDISTAATTLGT